MIWSTLYNTCNVQNAKLAQVEDVCQWLVQLGHLVLEQYLMNIREFSINGKALGDLYSIRHLEERIGVRRQHQRLLLSEIENLREKYPNPPPFYLEGKGARPTESHYAAGQQRSRILT